MARRSAAVLAGLFAALAVLFALGAFRRLDQWAIDRLMPGASFGHAEGGALEALVPLLHSSWDGGWAIAANLVTLPASFLVAAALAALLSRGLLVALLAAVAVETLCKEVVAGPALYSGSFHIAAFDTSFPSGHTLRAVILAGAVAILFPRLRVWAIAWAATAIALLELAGWHTPSDIAGGVVLGLLALLGGRAAGALGGRRLARGRPA